MHYSARRKNDVSALQQYLREDLLNLKIRRAFEVAEHHYMHGFPLENKESIPDKLEDFVFNKKEFFPYFKQPDLSKRSG